MKPPYPLYIILMHLDTTYSQWRELSTKTQEKLIKQATKDLRRKGVE